VCLTLFEVADITNDPIHVSANDIGKRLDAFLAEKIDGWSRGRLQRLIDDGDVLVNGRESKSSYKLRDGD
jgi:23S rRNA pseudouridine1911/1915/1917 synthase